MAICLVTGAKGGIGTHLCQRLELEGHQVVKMDLKIGTHHDIRQPVNVNVLMDAVRPDWVFHLAALADVVPSIEKPYDYHRTNVDGTVNLLEASRKFGVKRFIYAASASCYGQNPNLPVSISDDLEPAYPYALTKMIGESYALHYAKVYRLDVISLRLFNVYGPGFRSTGNYGAVLGVFLSQLANSAPLTIVGDGNQSRDFVHVRDVCEAFLLAAKSDQSGAVFNIGSGRPRSVNEIVKIMNPPMVLHLPDRPGEPRSIFADITWSNTVLNWRPRVDFTEGISELLKDVSLYKDSPLWTPEKIADATKEWFRCVK